jgi:hypothetical protein
MASTLETIPCMTATRPCNCHARPCQLPCKAMSAAMQGRCTAQLPSAKQLHQADAAGILCQSAVSCICFSAARLQEPHANHVHFVCCSCLALLALKATAWLCSCSSPMPVMCRPVTSNAARRGMFAAAARSSVPYSLWQPARSSCRQVSSAKHVSISPVTSPRRLRTIR